MSSRNPRVMIGASFGLAYILINAGELPSAIATTLRILGVIAFLGLLGAQIVRGRRTEHAPADQPRRPMFGRWFWIIVAVEIVVGWAGLLLINRVLDRPKAGVAWIALIVGLHFIALARAWQQQSIHWLGVAITTVGAAGPLLAIAGASAAVIATVAGIGSGTLLLAGSWWAVLQ